jgi:hypothetical protein
MSISSTYHVAGLEDAMLFLVVISVAVKLRKYDMSVTAIAGGVCRAVRYVVTTTAVFYPNIACIGIMNKLSTLQ